MFGLGGFGREEAAAGGGSGGMRTGGEGGVCHHLEVVWD